MRSGRLPGRAMRRLPNFKYVPLIGVLIAFPGDLFKAKKVYCEKLTLGIAGDFRYEGLVDALFGAPRSLIAQR